MDSSIIILTIIMALQSGYIGFLRAQRKQKKFPEKMKNMDFICELTVKEIELDRLLNVNEAIFFHYLNQDIDKNYKTLIKSCYEVFLESIEDHRQTIRNIENFLDEKTVIAVSTEKYIKQARDAKNEVR